MYLVGFIIGNLSQCMITWTSNSEFFFYDTALASTMNRTFWNQNWCCCEKWGFNWTVINYPFFFLEKGSLHAGVMLTLHFITFRHEWKIYYFHIFLVFLCVGNNVKLSHNHHFLVLIIHFLQPPEKWSTEVSLYCLLVLTPEGLGGEIYYCNNITTRKSG